MLKATANSTLTNTSTFQLGFSRRLKAKFVTAMIYKAFKSPVRHIPGPFHTLITRLPLKYYIVTGQRLHYVHSLLRAYGPIVRISPHEIATCDPDAFTSIHRIGSGFLKSPWYDTISSAPEPGIFMMRDPKEHAARRKLFARAFSKNALGKNWGSVIRAKVDKAVEQLKSEGKGKGEVDILKWWTLMATDVIGHLSFGQSFNMLDIGRKTNYINVLESSLFGSGMRAELPLLHALARFIPIQSIQAIVNGDAYLQDYGRRAVSNLRRQSGNAANLFGTMLNSSIAGESDMQDSLSDRSICLEAGNLIVAGSDTTAVTLTYLTWAVLKKPELQLKLEAEVATLNEDFEDADVERLPLVAAVIEETLRLYGAAPGSLPRTVPSGGSTLAGYFIPEGYSIETQAYTLHRDPNIFANPLQFDESRFLDSSPLTATQKQVFSPFGAGSRVCIGVHLARSELRLSAAAFFRKCRGARLSGMMTDEMMEIENHFLIAPKAHVCNIVIP
ncbi:hypothetical protein FE257_008611 [Aspergillus nanangensis]|uniref:Cytochrome P450 n=1 Tax=Aspergillus nanangensis TaxID=2582783 RepID=A0AAD4CL22_ASPNN|nr:hypothetical protein FE257_008611 [Aspergillus nanangensis]